MSSASGWRRCSSRYFLRVIRADRGLRVAPCAKASPWIGVGAGAAPLRLLRAALRAERRHLRVLQARARRSPAGDRGRPGRGLTGRGRLAIRGGCSRARPRAQVRPPPRSRHGGGRSDHSSLPDEELAGVVVPVPAAPWRWRWRGFDPAEEIALALAARGGLPYAACLRRAHGPRQVGRERRARLTDPPRVRAAGPVPRRALLVDDVHTTGATLAACAAALNGDDCERVVALTLARSEKQGLPPGDGRRSIVRPTRTEGGPA